MGPFLDSLTRHLRGRTGDPAEAVVEAIAHTLERLPHERYLGLLMTPGKASAFSAGVTSDMAMSFGRSLLERIDVDWRSAGIHDGDLDYVVEFMLHMLQSLIVDPGRPPHQGKELRDFLRRWIAPALSGSYPADAATKDEASSPGASLKGGAQPRRRPTCHPQPQPRHGDVVTTEK